MVPGSRTIEIPTRNRPKRLLELRLGKSLHQEVWLLEQPHVVAADEIRRIGRLRMPIPRIALCGFRRDISIEQKSDELVKGISADVDTLTVHPRSIEQARVMS
jgi:hypothetical protein